MSRRHLGVAGTEERGRLADRHHQDLADVLPPSVYSIPMLGTASHHSSRGFDGHDAHSV